MPTPDVIVSVPKHPFRQSDDAKVGIRLAPGFCVDLNFFPPRVAGANPRGNVTFHPIRAGT